MPVEILGYMICNLTTGLKNVIGCTPGLIVLFSVRHNLVIPRPKQEMKKLKNRSQFHFLLILHQQLGAKLSLD
jgi:hypothetical protein